MFLASLVPEIQGCKVGHLAKFQENDQLHVCCCCFAKRRPIGLKLGSTLESQVREQCAKFRSANPRLRGQKDQICQKNAIPETRFFSGFRRPWRQTPDFNMALSPTLQPTFSATFCIPSLCWKFLGKGREFRLRFGQKRTQHRLRTRKPPSIRNNSANSKRIRLIFEHKYADGIYKNCADFGQDSFTANVFSAQGYKSKFL